MNPLGLFGPGESSRAMIPAMKPTMMIQMNAAHGCRPFQGSMMSERGATRSALSRRQSRPRQFVLVRQPPVRRQMVDHVGQILAEALQQFVARQSALRRQMLDLVGAERVGEVARRDLLVGAVADPGIGRVALALLLELVEQVAEAAAEDAAGGAAREQSAEPALEQVAEAAAATAGQAGVDIAGRGAPAPAAGAALRAGCRRNA